MICFTVLGKKGKIVAIAVETERKQTRSKKKKIEIRKTGKDKIM